MVLYEQNNRDLFLPKYQAYLCLIVMLISCCKCHQNINHSMRTYRSLLLLKNQKHGLVTVLYVF